MIPTAITTLIACNFPTGIAGLVFVIFCLGVLLTKAIVTFVVPAVLVLTVIGGSIMLAKAFTGPKTAARNFDSVADYE